MARIIVTNGNNPNGPMERGRCLYIEKEAATKDHAMTKRNAARFLAAGLLGLSLSGIAYGRGGHSGSGGFHGSGAFHGSSGFHHFGHDHFHSHAFIGGGVVLAPFYYPPPDYYPPPAVQYVEPSPAPSTQQPGYWYYCPDSQQYYPYAQQCPGGWQPVAPQPPS
jgi:hypothetical protein